MTARGFRHARRLLGVGGVALLFCGCDLPTSAPTWDTSWSVNAGRFSVTPADLLPDEVEPDGNSFSVPVPPALTTVPLSTLCPECLPEVPEKPAFTGQLELESGLPIGIEAADIRGGDVTVSLRHGWTFDPLRPGGALTGAIQVQLLGGREPAVLDQAVLDGADTAFPADTTVIVTLTLPDGVVEGGGGIRVLVESPAGPPGGPGSRRPAHRPAASHVHPGPLPGRVRGRRGPGHHAGDP